jgi:hypothetical protein
MALKSLYVGDVVQEGYNYLKRAYENTVECPNYNEEDTYVLIFGPYQEYKLAKFRKVYGKDIIFEGKKACNRNYKTGPRNTLIIFEKQKDV